MAFPGTLVHFMDHNLNQRLTDKIQRYEQLREALAKAARERLRFIGRWRGEQSLANVLYARERLFFVEVDGISLAVSALSAEDAMRVAQFLVWKDRHGSSD
jgi:hypothetical protein